MCVCVCVRDDAPHDTQQSTKNFDTESAPPPPNTSPPTHSISSHTHITRQSIRLFTLHPQRSVIEIVMGDSGIGSADLTFTFTWKEVRGEYIVSSSTGDEESARWTVTDGVAISNDCHDHIAHRVLCKSFLSSRIAKKEILMRRKHRNLLEPGIVGIVEHNEEEDRHSIISSKGRIDILYAHPFANDISHRLVTLKSIWDHPVITTDLATSDMKNHHEYIERAFVHARQLYHLICERESNGGQLLHPVIDPRHVYISNTPIAGVVDKVLVLNYEHDTNVLDGGRRLMFSTLLSQWWKMSRLVLYRMLDVYSHHYLANNTSEHVIQAGVRLERLSSDSLHDKQSDVQGLFQAFDELSRQVVLRGGL